MRTILIVFLLKLANYLSNQRKKNFTRFDDANTLIIDGEGYSKYAKFIVKNNRKDFYLSIIPERSHYAVDFDLTEDDAEKLIKHLQYQIRNNKLRKLTS